MTKSLTLPKCVAIVLLLCGCGSAPPEDTALVAVATNFSEVAKRIETEFEAQSTYDVTLTTGSTGQLYAQVKSGAPFDVLLAADQERPAKLEEEGSAVNGSRFTYATGALSLWGPKLPDVSEAVLKQGQFRRLALANPNLAPYGRASQETLEALGIYDLLAPKIVRGENIGQTYGLIATGNAELGFVATSALKSQHHKPSGAVWNVPRSLHGPINQDAVLLMHGQDNEAAKAFLRFLKSRAALDIMSRYGYTAS